MGCNSCKKKEYKENFINLSSFLSDNWIFVVIGLIIIICLIYFLILKPTL
jgi:hypothetical protein